MSNIPELSKPWRCKIRMCYQWSEPVQAPFILETRKGNRETVRLAKFDKHCVDCGRAVLVGYQEVPAS